MGKEGDSWVQTQRKGGSHCKGPSCLAFSRNSEKAAVTGSRVGRECRRWGRTRRRLISQGFGFYSETGTCQNVFSKDLTANLTHQDHSGCWLENKSIKGGGRKISSAVILLSHLRCTVAYTRVVAVKCDQPLDRFWRWSQHILYLVWSGVCENKINQIGLLDFWSKKLGDELSFTEMGKTRNGIVLGDLERFFERWFPEGHLDLKKTVKQEEHSEERGVLDAPGAGKGGGVVYVVSKCCW